MLYKIRFADNKAFTLMELMIVIVIIGILAAVGMVMFGGQAEKAKIAVAKSNYKLVVKQVKLIVTNCEIEGSVQLMSTINSKKYYTHTCYGNVQAFFPEYFKNHINNQTEWINKFSVTGWNGKNMYVLQEGSMYNYHAGFVFLRVPSNSNKRVWVNLGTCFKQPCTDAKNQLETQISFNQW